MLHLFLHQLMRIMMLAAAGVDHEREATTFYEVSTTRYCPPPA
jgi:hypothetical protein